MASSNVFFRDQENINRFLRDQARFETDLDQVQQDVRSAMDGEGQYRFRRRVWAVAASGFLTTSYIIFSTNVIGPALQYVYPNCGSNPSLSNSNISPLLIINLTTLVGITIGMLLFGYLADRNGRKALYGVELVIVVIGTIGMTSATQGKEGAHGALMNIYGWIGFWRFFQGVGLGAEYPLSAIIAVEWSSTQARGKMLAAVFLMQSIGQLAAYGLGLAILVIVKNASGLDPNEDDYSVAAPIIDIFWRVVIAIGVFPAICAIWLRRQLPETPLWLIATGRIDEGGRALRRVYPHGRISRGRRLAILEQRQVEDQGHRLLQSPQSHQSVQGQFTQPGSSRFSVQRPPVARQHASAGVEPTGSRSGPPPGPPSSSGSEESGGEGNLGGSDDEEDDDEDKNLWQRFRQYTTDVWAHLVEPEKNRLRALLGVMIVWFLVDLAFYSLGLDSPRTIQKIWLANPVANADANQACDQLWRTDPAQPNISIYNMLEEDTIRNMITISTGAVTGSVLALLAIDLVPRVAWMAVWFLALAAVFVVMGSTFFSAYQSDRYALTITLYVLAQVLFNLGPNTITFMLPAELFATRFRGTFYGLAAAAGKVGAVVSQVANSLAVQNRGSHEFSALVLAGMVPAMLLGAAVAWFWIPEVQRPFDPRHAEAATTGGAATARSLFAPSAWLRPSRTLEEIAENPSGRQTIGVRRRLGIRRRHEEPRGGENGGVPMRDVGHGR